jgi:carbonic anhydrase
MKEKLNILIIIGLFYSIFSFEEWRDYPTCRLGRLQSPIEIKEVDSTYSNDFSFVYQNYKQISSITITNKTYAFSSGDIKGGYINFERGGVIKQYELIRIDIYPGLHKIDGITSDYEVHLIHKKNLDFNTNKNQYRSIQDANMYLSVVLRYSTKTNCKDNSKISCTSDNGLFDKLKTLNTGPISLNNYPIFQDKRAFLYEGSSLQIPCDENVNYYVVNDFFAMEGEDFNTLKDKTIKIANSFDRPIYKNFMNYREVMKSDAISIKLLTLIILLFFLL